jgi:hypothetical protein
MLEYRLHSRGVWKAQLSGALQIKAGIEIQDIRGFGLGCLFMPSLFQTLYLKKIMPRLDQNGRVITDNWPPVRKALEAGYEFLKETYPGNLPQRDWNIAVLAIHFYNEQNRRKCCECKKELYGTDDIRCLDCRSTFCPYCAEKHFWPNGRSKEDKHY